MARTAFYPGSFDPVTLGHLDIIRRAAHLADRLVIGVGCHAAKHSLLPASVRLELLQKLSAPISLATGTIIEAVAFEGLTIVAARSVEASFMVRGLRDATDFDYEVQMSQMNGKLEPALETVFLVAAPETRMIASSLVKQIARMGGDISAFVPQEVAEAVRKATDLAKPRES